VYIFKGDDTVVGGRIDFASRLLPTPYCSRCHFAAPLFVVSRKSMKDDIKFVGRNGVVLAERTGLGGRGTQLIQETVLQILRACNGNSLFEQ
jgi:hypothetical protein